MVRYPGLAFRGMTNALRERDHEDKQAKKNVQRIKIGMVEFELWLDLGSRDLSMGQEDIKAGTLEEYATVLSFELLRTVVHSGDCAGKG
ncbi:hypothetical protein B296_00018124 [Ensete ventricosum]|uniref:Uncharacterized protein n=1 Tax=Ensete ventricosum TaxID=4639 RepID=A0A426Y3J8_ENSVE|nr:hypothetical protein B296_00018124 [Ensete ventricosum]